MVAPGFQGSYRPVPAYRNAALHIMQPESAWENGSWRRALRAVLLMYSKRLLFCFKGSGFCNNAAVARAASPLAQGCGGCRVVCPRKRACCVAPAFYRRIACEMPPYARFDGWRRVGYTEAELGKDDSGGSRCQAKGFSSASRRRLHLHCGALQNPHLRQAAGCA